MILQFPNARLFIHDLLSKDHISGPEAIVQGAYEFGILAANSCSGILSKQGRDDCCCIIATKQVLHHYFVQTAQSMLITNGELDKAYKNIERQLSDYEQQQARGKRCAFRVAHVA